ncbi:MAG: isoprenylcysteine carboxylmethyltransferase family protein [Deltaproteobacteria bacterium]|nr:MAG: isoprenylcysteine carboxylmethyltransferase family protein [Deltaproteobacteria bacterium]
MVTRRSQVKSLLPTIIDSYSIRLAVLIISIILTNIVVIWSLKSLPPKFRGEYLVTTGAYAYIRHPLYGAFLSFFNFGLAIYLNNYIFIIWAVLLFPVWHLNIRYEENLVVAKFGDEYVNYSKRVSRFFPFKKII